MGHILQSIPLRPQGLSLVCARFSEIRAFSEIVPRNVAVASHTAGGRVPRHRRVRLHAGLSFTRSLCPQVVCIRDLIPADSAHQG